MGSQVNNPPSSDPVNAGIYDHVYYAYDSVSKIPGNIAGSAASQAQRLYVKVDELKNRYLTANFIKTKTKQTIIAKVLPLSTPKDLEKEIKKTKEEIAFLSDRLKDCESKLSKTHKKIEEINQRPTKSNDSLKKSLSIQKDLLTNYTHQIAVAKENIKKNQSILNYLDLKKASTIRGRFTGWAGWVSDLAIPGSGRVVGTMLTAMNLLAQQNSLNVLPDQQNIRSSEQKNVNIGTLLTVATSISSIAFAVFAMPILKETAVTTWRSWYPIPSF